VVCFSSNFEDFSSIPSRHLASVIYTETQTEERQSLHNLFTKLSKNIPEW